MNYRTLGRSGIRVSEIGLGAEHLQGKDYETVKAVIDEAEAQGINIMDVFMSEPQIRSDIGKAISNSREYWILQGHFCSVWKDGQYARSRDMADVQFFFEDLLKRLQTDYIDIGMLHFVDTDADYDAVFNSEIIKYALDCKEKGVIKLLGLSSHNAAVAKKAVDTGLIDVLMFSVNPAYDLMPSQENIDNIFKPDMLQTNTVSGIHPDRAALYQSCLENGCAVTVMKTFCGGMLLNEKVSPFGEALKPYPLIHYALTRPAVSSALIGCTAAGQVRYAAAYCADSTENDFSGIFKMQTRYNPRGACVYCNHCLPCPSRIDIAQVNKYLDMAGPATVAEHYRALPVKAGGCIQCGKCEPNCPFGVKIRERMKKAAEVFGE
jgi:predicted aldo/keto reductase-like oxidoreductase